jgi:hypothetical protein
VLGVLLIVLGSVFSAFGRFLQGAICRDQEFVADRAAVDLLGSREPLVRALRKIGGVSAGGVLRAPTAMESSHLFFCQAAQGLAASAFPSHPLIEERIRAIDPDWDGHFLSSEARTPSEDEGLGEEALLESEEHSGGSTGQPVSQYAKGLLHVVQHAVFPAAGLEMLGCGWSWSRIEQGRSDRASLRPDWIQLTLSREGVKRLVFEICRQSDTSVDGILLRSTAGQKMLLLDLAMPLLRRMSLEEFVSLNRKVRREVRRGEFPDLLRYLFGHIFARRMQICLGLREPVGVVYEEFSSIWQEAQVLVSLMSREGAPTPNARASAYGAAWKWLGLETPPYQEQVSMLELGKTLDSCAQASPILKKKLLAACGIAAGYEGHVAEREMVILRLFADALGTPLPNLVG